MGKFLKLHHKVYQPPAGPTGTGAEAIWLFENNGDDEKGTYTIVATDGATYDGAVYVEGSYSGKCSTGDYFAVPQMDLGNEFTIVAEFNVAEASYQTVYSNLVGGDDGIEIRLHTDTDYIYVISGDNIDTDTAYASSAGMSVDTWHCLIITFDRTAGTCAIYLDGDDVTTDENLQPDFGNNAVARLGRSTTDDNQLWGYLDAVQIYKRILTSDERATIIATPGTEVFG